MAKQHDKQFKLDIEPITKKEIREVSTSVVLKK